MSAARGGDTADVVVVGAGVNGVSTAFHLAEAGARVTVVERRHFGAGATGKSGALVRTHYTNEPETKLALESMRYFRDWGERVGGDCGFREAGLLVFVPPELDAHAEANVAAHRALGIDVRLLAPDEATELDPALRVDDVTRVVYEPGSGYADPNATTHAFARAAERHGAEFRLDTEVARVLHEGGRVTGVETKAGTIHAPAVVIVAGAWANRLLAPLDVDLGLVPRTARVAAFSAAIGRPAGQLTLIDHRNRTWARPIDDNGTLIGTEIGALTVDDPDTFPETPPQDYLDLCRTLLERRVPIMRHSNVRGGWTGVLMQSPDGRPIIDRLGPEGLYCITGDSGSSFKTAPAIGLGVAEWIVRGAPETVDLAPFGAARIREGRPWRDPHPYSTETQTVSR